VDAGVAEGAVGSDAAEEEGQGHPPSDPAHHDVRQPGADDERADGGEDRDGQRDAQGWNRL
jgi:hypothetical protein